MDWIRDFYQMLFPLDVQAQRVESAYHLKHTNFPSSLFKYRRVDDYALKNLRSGTVWLADPDTLNDPYDCAYTIDIERFERDHLRSLKPDYLTALPDGIDREALISAMGQSGNPRQVLFDVVLRDVDPSQRTQLSLALAEVMADSRESYLMDVAAKIKRSFKLCSFSERVDSTLMWAHYADNHRGFCIEYGLEGLTPDILTNRFMYPVLYTDELFDVTEHVMRGVEHPSFNNLHWNMAGLRKASDWSYEREWRLLFANGVIDEGRDWRMPAPKTVYLGSHISHADQQTILDICESIGVPIQKMRHSRTRYQMDACAVAVADKKPPKFAPPDE